MKKGWSSFARLVFSVIFILLVCWRSRRSKNLIKENHWMVFFSEPKKYGQNFMFPPRQEQEQHSFLQDLWALLAVKNIQQQWRRNTKYGDPNICDIKRSLNYSRRVFKATHEKIVIILILSPYAVEHNEPTAKLKQEYPS